MNAWLKKAEEFTALASQLMAEGQHAASLECAIVAAKCLDIGRTLERADALLAEAAPPRRSAP
jgi:hypothetical protein